MHLISIPVPEWNSPSKTTYYYNSALFVSPDVSGNHTEKEAYFFRGDAPRRLHMRLFDATGVQVMQLDL